MGNHAGLAGIAGRTHAIHDELHHRLPERSAMDRYDRIVTLHRLLKSAHYPLPLPRLMNLF